VAGGGEDGNLSNLIPKLEQTKNGILALLRCTRSPYILDGRWPTVVNYFSG